MMEKMLVNYVLYAMGHVMNLIVCLQKEKMGKAYIMKKSKLNNNYYVKNNQNHRITVENNEVCKSSAR